MNALHRAWYALWQHASFVVFVIVFGLRVFHRERLPAAGGVLVVSNHQSYLDPIAVAAGMPRPFHPMARQSLFRFAPFGWLIRSLYAFPVRRASADMGAIREALRLLKGGGVVLMFPEGTRTRDGSIGRLHAGPVTIAARAGVPIVPAVVDGAFESWPRTSPLPRPHRVYVAFGPPVSAAEAAAGEPEAVMAALRERMVDLQAELNRLRQGEGGG